jgi:hypothetical protein
MIFLRLALIITMGHTRNHSRRTPNLLNIGLSEILASSISMVYHDFPIFSHMFFINLNIYIIFNPLSRGISYPPLLDTANSEKSDSEQLIQDLVRDGPRG